MNRERPNYVQVILDFLAARWLAVIALAMFVAYWIIVGQKPTDLKSIVDGLPQTPRTGYNVGSPQSRQLTLSSSNPVCLFAGTSLGVLHQWAIDTASLKSSSNPVDLILTNLPTGNIAYTAAKSIPLDGEGFAALGLSAVKSTDELAQWVQWIEQTNAMGDTARKFAQSKLGSRMQATLTPVVKGSMEVIPLRETVQAVSYIEDTVWAWRIVPKEPGEWRLNIRLDILVKIENETTPRTLTSFEDSITISATRTQRLGRFWSSNWQWIVSTLALPVLIFGGRYLWNLKKDRQQAKAKGPVGFAKPTKDDSD